MDRIRDACDIMVIIIGEKHGEQNSNLRRRCMHFTSR